MDPSAACLHHDPWPTYATSPLCAAHLPHVPCLHCDPHLPSLLVCSMPCILSVSFIHFLPLTCTLYRVQGGFGRVAAAPQTRLKERQSAMSSCNNWTEQRVFPAPYLTVLVLRLCTSLLALQLLGGMSTWDLKSLHVACGEGRWLYRGSWEREGEDPSLQLITMPSYIQMS